jgi:hypothetical protein
LIQSLLSRLALSGSSYLPSFVGQLQIEFGQFTWFSRISVALISGSAAAIIGIIRRGSLRGASILIFLFIGISIAVYQLFFLLLSNVFVILFQLA